MLMHHDWRSVRGSPYPYDSMIVCRIITSPKTNSQQNKTNKRKRGREKFAKACVGLLMGVLDTDINDRVLRSLDTVVSKEDWHNMIFSYREPIHYSVDNRSPTPKRKTSKAESLHTAFKKAKIATSPQPSSEDSVGFLHGLGDLMHNFS
ncbi:hypothetical protein GJ744_011516 [Endocarpon pusillum]|uniref:Uncharacterized protein n=1 Tax=Endocarpon pusillum TaxID=364733 RepID=A0A8H7AF54_9EURO|nr:hypothetical protein GJ744_011516 [Endocarpon pusillum]